MKPQCPTCKKLKEKWKLQEERYAVILAGYKRQEKEITRLKEELAKADDIKDLAKAIRAYLLERLPAAYNDKRKYEDTEYYSIGYHNGVDACLKEIRERLWT